jgi:uncharacterized protein YoxC
MNWYEISAVSAASAFVALVLYALWTLHAAKEFMRKTDASITRFTETADETMHLSRQLLRAMRTMIDDAHAQSQKLQGVLGAVSEFGGAVSDAAAGVRKAASALARWTGTTRDGAEECKDDEPAKRRQPSGRSDARKDPNPEWMRIAIHLYRSFRDTSAQQAGASDARRQE